MTNVRKHRKAYPVWHCWQRRGESRGEPLFYWRSLSAAGKKLGACTCSLDGVKGGDMCGRNHAVNSGESLFGPARSVGKRAYKPTGESARDARQEVGDGHSTLDAVDSITTVEERAVSLDMPYQLQEVPA